MSLIERRVTMKRIRYEKGRREDLPERYTIHIPTPENWYPTYEDGTVRVSVLNVTSTWGRPAVRVVVWGADDYGMVRDEYLATAEEARECFARRVREVTNWGLVSGQMLKDLGFRVE
jgi:hypothetical protein